MTAQFDVTELIGRTRLEARPYQQRIVAKAVSCFLDKGMKSVLIDSPTGAGKTNMSLLICKAMQELAGAKIGWVSMRRNLLAQAKTENEKYGTGVDMKLISMFDKRLPDGLDMLVIDEAQHDAAGSMGHIHAAVKPRYIVGLSGTPWRADRVKLCFDTVIRDAGIHKLIQDGYLSKYHHFTIPNWEPRTVIDFYLREPLKWGKTIIYYHRLEHCWQTFHELTEAGVPCAVVDGASDCEAQVQKLRGGELSVLLSCLKLTEGLNVVELKTVFVRPSCKGVTIQMGGRVFRKCPDLPFKQVVQSADTKWPFPRTAAAALTHVHVNGGWRTIEPSDAVDRVSKRMLAALATSNADMPAYVLKKLGKRSDARHWSGKGEQGNETPYSGAADAPE